MKYVWVITYVIKHNMKIQRGILRDFKEKKQTSKVILTLSTKHTFLTHSGNVMNCHATVPGSIPGQDGVFTELHVLRKGQ